MQGGCCGRKLFGTRNGYVGLGDVMLKQGDRVCVFLGARTPFVVREKPGGKWGFVGKCFVHGIMFGEAVKEGINTNGTLTLA